MTVEQRLREHLASIEGTEVPGAGAMTAAAIRAGRRLRRRRRTAVAVSAATLLGGGIIAIGALVERDANRVVAPVDGTSTSTPEPTTSIEPPSTSSASVVTSTDFATTTTSAPTGPWTPIPRDPRGPTSLPGVVWTGTEALVFGGTDPDGRPRREAVAYSPADRTWRPLADPPDEIARGAPLVVWTGQEALVIGGERSDGSGLSISTALAFDPVTDAWRTVAPGARGTVTNRSPWGWTGAELLVWPDGVGIPRAYDPQTDSWHLVAAPPINPRESVASVWTGTEWIVWGGADGETERDDGAAYDPATDTWRVLAASPLSARRVGAVWTGSEMIVAAGWRGTSVVGSPLALSDGAAYDPATDTWRPIHEGFAHPGFVPVWTGTQMVMFAKAGAVVYDLATDHWTDVCCDGIAGGTPVWTGTTVLLVGSLTADVGGALFTAPV